MHSWKDLIQPRDDIISERFDEAMFTAALDDVIAKREKNPKRSIRNEIMNSSIKRNIKWSVYTSAPVITYSEYTEKLEKKNKSELKRSELKGAVLLPIIECQQESEVCITK
jgi:hypothetical protein